jgi:glutathione peroxidase
MDSQEVMVMSIYDFTVTNNQGQPVPLSEYRGKVILVVNTASKCGFTPQLGPLQELYQSYREQGFVVLAFPSNQFAGQEPESDARIAQFYFNRYGVEFPIMTKCDVNGPAAIPLYKWLRRQKGGLFGRQIKWNFTKFLINRQGEVVSRFASSLDPQKLRPDIEKLLAEPG